MKARIRQIAFAEAAALLRADMDSADLECEKTLSEADAEAVREYIRVRIVALLEDRADE